jgi:mono/diheme cytochrome c family protein
VRIEALLAAVVVAAACIACEPAADAAPAEVGKRIYLANCIACHNQDPAKEGTLGPAVAGSSLELVEARILRAAYPPGYTPKRDSHLMPAQPFLKGDVPALAAYLESVAPK